MPFRCPGGNCAWDDELTDDDVTGHSTVGLRPTFEIVHVDDPTGGHLVRIRFEDTEEERAFLARLDRDRRAKQAS